MLTEKQNRTELIESNIGLVHACANRFRGKGVEYDDLFQAGCVGLIKAVDGFDGEKGCAFSTYAVPAILGEIKRIFRDGGSVKVGRTMKERAVKLLASKEALTKILGNEPTLLQLSEYASYSPAETAELLMCVAPPLSLSGDGADGEGERGVFDIPVETHENELTDTMALRECIASLPDRDRIMVECRYFRGLTQAKTAKLLGMSQVQVSRREKAVLAEIKKRLSE